MFKLLGLERKNLGSNKLPSLSVGSLKEQVSSALTSENLFPSSDVSCWCVWSVAFAIICVLDGSTITAVLPTWNMQITIVEVSEKYLINRKHTAR
jgi:hypothetical protein